MARSISTRGTAVLDKWLDTTSAAGTVPALFLGVATKDKILYYNCKGDRVQGEPDKGQVNQDTSEGKAVLLTRSAAVVVHDQARHLDSLSATEGARGRGL